MAHWFFIITGLEFQNREVLSLYRLLWGHTSRTVHTFGPLFSNWYTVLILQPVKMRFTRLSPGKRGLMGHIVLSSDEWNKWDPNRMLNLGEQRDVSTSGRIANKGILRLLYLRINCSKPCSRFLCFSFNKISQTCPAQNLKADVEM